MPASSNYFHFKMRILRLREFHNLLDNIHSKAAEESGLGLTVFMFHGKSSGLGSDRPE